jgi:hypothetical protein
MVQISRKSMLFCSCRRERKDQSDGATLVRFSLQNEKSAQTAKEKQYKYRMPDLI